MLQYPQDQPDSERERAQEVYRRVAQIVHENRDRWYPTSLSHFVGQPFKALIASMLSAQTREEQTTAACNALFAVADNPFDMSDQLRAVLPCEAWIHWKAYMGQFGRAICQLRRPKCPVCPVNDRCPKIGVTEVDPGR